MSKLKAAIVGITGYTGEELLKILLRHPGVEVSVVAGRSSSENKPVKELYPSIGETSLVCENLDIDSVAKRADVVFLALPHKVSFEIAPKFLEKGARVVDLSADFRLESAEVYEKWYGEKHTAPAHLKKAVYGLPELYRAKIKNASLVANPGCYPTTIILGLLPVLKEGLIDLSSVISDSKSGISGAGRKTVAEYYSSEHPNLRAYNIAGAHRHIPEIEQELSKIVGKDIAITFTPHIFPEERGMLSSIYSNLKKKISTAEAVQLYKEFYSREPFVEVLSEGKLPGIRDVVNTNYCRIGLKVDERTGRLVVISVIDNLLKGASGQAVQNMNIMFGIDEKTGL
ncbi:MAG TPA: N-acetyl-gamma-glutamyl-phosphate reductase [Elusimicrobia bacterium]|nr:MAG: N-acetyl-gamma-glutamyl-phosphate reductase [Elusimicrobia bacterium RIFOXYA12_FULL_49_49]OGS11610.1 MAG: N-acetyl-gamma-glutamyl-phosphate reductase [Elusimicrobia bacterium RIFOXYB1_FULL_48_9]OGS14962.1 MAG: N-acetyl-gamma-glutamyl-phosphate reductase [Elusimicrobia bacterium RIFOXYA2_FULL_47_53]OGS26103.1 MAG: N-acetyl-gamma-glutamyl-phosphate reductase [Elusimicrobia bacterium RIFOXYB12_FULL_50_12]OGS29307.1 MAG: N-acetyl-gamma-glutamyl-phosphate reductase [Elusimicrobia bacterium R